MEDCKKKHQIVIQKGLKGILKGIDEKKVILYDPISYEDLLKINKKKMKMLKVKQLIAYMKECLYWYKRIIEIYKEMYNKTEFYENQSCLDFKFDEWNIFRKANGKMTKQYNELLSIYKKYMEEEN